MGNINIADKSEFNSSSGGYLERYVVVKGQKKIVRIKVSGIFLSLNSIEKINELLEEIPNDFNPVFEIDSTYYFDHDGTHSRFHLLEKKPDWTK